MLWTDQIGIWSDKNAELADSRCALTFPDVCGIAIRTLAALAYQGHKEWSIDAVGAEAG